MRGFSVFSALIGTIIFIIAIVVVTLFIRTDIILKTNTISSDYANQLEGVAGVVNAVFQATIIDVGEKTIEKVLSDGFPNDPNLVTTLFCDDNSSCYESLTRIISKKFNDQLQDQKTEIAKRIINIVLGKANSDAIDSFKKCFDLRLDPKENKVVVVTKGTANLSIDIGGTYRKYEFTVVANDFDTEYDFSILKKVANVVGTIFKNLPEITAECKSQPICDTPCCESYDCGKDHNSCCESIKTTTCLIWDNVYLSNSFMGKSLDLSRNVVEELIKNNGYKINYSIADIKNKISKIIDDLKNLKNRVENAKVGDEISKELNLEKGIINKYVDQNKKNDILKQLDYLIKYFRSLVNKKIICIDKKTVESIISNLDIKKYLKNKIYSYQNLISQDKTCYLEKQNYKNNQYSNKQYSYWYYKIKPKVGLCPDISEYYNDKKFKQDVENYIKINLNNLIDINNFSTSNIEIIDNTTKGAGNFIPENSCPSCGCIPKGEIYRFYKIKEIKITLPIKICKIHDPNNCKIIYIKFVKS